MIDQTRLIQFLQDPAHVGDAGEPRFTGRMASIRCGAALRMSIQIDETQHISQVRFKAAGCNVLVASLEILSQNVEGKSPTEAALYAQDPRRIAELLGTADTDVEFCTALACDALLNAIQDYSNAARSEWIGDEALICTCFFVSERTIEQEIRTNSLSSVAEVTRACNAGAGCGSCHQLIQEILDCETGS
jgi:NifU-like protein